MPDNQAKDVQALHRAVMRGSGFYDYMSGRDLAETVAISSSETEKQAQVQQWRDLPVVNFLDGLSQEWADALCEEALPEDRARFKAYLSEKVLGIGIITAVCLRHLLTPNLSTDWLTRDLDSARRPL